MSIDNKEILKHLVRFNPGEIIFKEGEPANCFYYIKNGSVLIYKKNEKGEEIKLNELKEGEIFGELSLLDVKDNFRTASAKAITHITLISATKENLNELLKSNPTFSTKLVSILISRFSSSEKKLFKIINYKEKEGLLYWYLINTLLLIMTNNYDKYMKDIKIEISFDKVSTLINDKFENIDYLMNILENYLTGKPKELDENFIKETLEKFDNDKFNHKYKIKFL